MDTVSLQESKLTEYQAIGEQKLEMMKKIAETDLRNDEVNLRE